MRLAEAPKSLWENVLGCIWIWSGAKRSSQRWYECTNIILYRWDIAKINIGKEGWFSEPPFFAGPGCWGSRELCLGPRRTQGSRWNTWLRQSKIASFLERCRIPQNHSMIHVGADPVLVWSGWQLCCLIPIENFTYKSDAEFISRRNC